MTRTQLIWTLAVVIVLGTVLTGYVTRPTSHAVTTHTMDDPQLDNALEDLLALRWCYLRKVPHVNGPENVPDEIRTEARDHIATLSHEDKLDLVNTTLPKQRSRSLLVHWITVGGWCICALAVSGIILFKRR